MKQAKLWKNSFGDAEKSSDTKRLSSSLERVRENAELLTSKIAASLPNLTIHNISHLDALWDIADVIAGDDFPINPLEVYIFGCAVMLHDAGLCFEAYSGGLEGVRSTVQWKDAHSRLSGTPNLSPENLLQEADFEALRSLHARQAVDLATKPWKINGSDDLYIIEDSELRENYGKLIGEIASSHHWRIEKLVDRFSVQRPVAVFLDATWNVDALKIACLLRTADAGHIDAARAPSFLLKILQMNSISRAHWVAQNHLGRVAVKTDDSTQLVIASTKPFTRTESGAWWVAFDAIELLDRELRDSNEALSSAPNGPRQGFARKRVAGAGKVKEVAKYVETSGWEPTESTVHVSDVAALVGKLGGEQLYGKTDHFDIALRELLQNAADAVGARVAITKSLFHGRITIRLIKGASGAYVLQVDDNGVGMSQTTLTDDLLDFGKSFWSSQRATDEFQGLLSSGYSPRGQFGIGFFSVFMAAKKVRVFSRKFDRGIEDVRCLSFENGLSLRPTLSADRPDDLEMNTSTRVELELKRSAGINPDAMEVKGELQNHDNFHVPLRYYVAAMVCGIDVPVFLEWNGNTVQVQKNFPPCQNSREKWLSSLSYFSSGMNQGVREDIANAVSRLTEIRDEQRHFGLAAINFSYKNYCDFLSAKAVGGLVNPHNRYGAPFIGLIEHLPSNASRNPGEIAATKCSMESWLLEQTEILKSAKLSKIETINASYSLCEFDYDPIDFFQGIYLTMSDKPQFMQYFPIRDLPRLLRGGSRLGFRVSPYNESLDYLSGLSTLPSFDLCVIHRNGKFNDAHMVDGVPKNLYSLIGVVHRVLVQHGEVPKWERLPNKFTSIFGAGDCLELKLS